MIEFRTLGSAELVGPEGTDARAVLARPKLLGLLAFLSAGADRGFHRRDSLIGCFWPELSQERARSAVRQSLYRLRQSLGEGVLVTRGDDEVAVSDETFWSDVRAFEDALAAGDRARALELYRGDLLAGFYVPDAPEFERWLDERRKDLRRRASTAAWELAEHEAGQKHTVAAGRWSRHARDLAPLDERLLRRVIQLLDRLGDRAGAVREYETFARRLELELELEPSPETKSLIDVVRRRSEPVSHQGPSPAREPRADSAAPPVAPSEPLPTGAFADRYRIQQEIGAGGMATVYRARDLRHDRDVAVKVMYPGLAAHVGAERFLREIKIAANLTHPHIVPVFDSGSADGRLFFVMPFIDGETLRARLQRDGQLPLDEALGYARDVAEALDYAHGHGVVHRDIKPENILLAGDHALVADFGIARAVRLAEDGDTRLTQAGLVVGTPDYMSPEQASGTGEVDHRSDLYSLACVVYEMLAGQPPFTGPSAEVVARQHMSSAPRPISELRPTASAHVSAAIAKALAKAPADRFSRVNQFAQALVTPSIVNLPLRRRRITWLVAAPIALVIVASLVTRLGRTPALDPNRVVVMPFENRTGDASLALLGSMAADWITQGLQEIDVIDVVPTATGIEPGPRVVGVAESSALHNARAAGEATGAGTVVAGSYYRRGDSLVFQAQVIDADARRLLRAVVPLAVPATASGAVLDSLRARVVTTVAAALDQRLIGSPAASQPPSLAAYRAYVQGHRAFYHAGPMRMPEVLEFMYQAVALDSTFPDPRFFIVMAHWNLGERRAADSNAQLLLPFRARFGPRQRALLDWLIASLRGDRAGALRAQRARGPGPDLAVEAMYSNRPHESIEILTDLEDLSIPGLYFKWDALMEALHMVGDHRRELDQARRARDVYPDRLLMLRNELRALAALGQLDAVEHGLDESLRLPAQGEVAVWELMLAVGAELRVHGYRDASLRVAERTLDWLASRPQDRAETVGNQMGRAMALYAAEQWDDARAVLQDLSAAMPGDVDVQGLLGVVAARRGDRAEALAISTQLLGVAGPYDFGRDLYWQACIAAQLGELDRAMVLLRDAHNLGRPFGIRLHRDMELEPLHGYPAFEAFLEPKG